MIIVKPSFELLSPLDEQMLEIMVPMLTEFKKRIPVVFDDLVMKEGL